MLLVENSQSLSPFLQQRHIAEMEILKDAQRLFPGIKDMLQACKPYATPVIVSNGFGEYLRKSMELTGVLQEFDWLESLIEGRSKAEALRVTLERYPGYKAIMIGDRLGDIDAGKANGIPTIACCYGYGHEEEYCQADMRVDTVEEL